MGAALDSMTGAQPHEANQQVDANRLRKLQLTGILSGFAAGAWLGAAEAPTKLVSLGISPVIISLLMVSGVFLARWTLPALIRGTSQMTVDAKQAPHLILWGVLAGCLWAVANTLTVFAIRDIGLSVTDIAALGVRRISVGGALALAGWTAFIRAAQALQSSGSFSGLADLVPYTEINALLETDFQSRKGRAI